MSGIRVAAVGDLHCRRGMEGRLGAALEAAREADVLLLCGDLTHHGRPDEARALAGELPAGMPIIAVLGNHDYESDRSEEVRAILTGAGVRVLDGESCTAAGAGFAGVKGYVGGFGSRELQPWGERTTKRVVQEAADEARKLDVALSSLSAGPRIVLMHYSPIAETVAGELPEVIPFLGCSRLEEPLRRHRVAAVFHGHAHFGSPEGRTASGVPVYNVAMPLLLRLAPRGPAMRVVRLEAA